MDIFARARVIKTYHPMVDQFSQENLLEMHVPGTSRGSCILGSGSSWLREFPIDEVLDHWRLPR